MNSPPYSEIAKAARGLGFKCLLDEKSLRIGIAGAELVVSLDEKETDGAIGFDNIVDWRRSELKDKLRWKVLAALVKWREVNSY